VYVTYIATTADRVWQALIDGQITRQYWGGMENLSDWREGSAWQHRATDAARTVRVMGKVIEVRPPNRLVLTWAEPDQVEDLAQHSRVAFDIDMVGNSVRLTVTHDQFAVGSQMPSRITNGWPRVLSSLKSLLETGTPLDIWATSSCATK
jgi:uncharacterized protein YndB with AHSA1/START domain